MRSVSRSSVEKLLKQIPVADTRVESTSVEYGLMVRFRTSPADNPLTLDAIWIQKGEWSVKRVLALDAEVAQGFVPDVIDGELLFGVLTQPDGGLEASFVNGYSLTVEPPVAEQDEASLLDFWAVYLAGGIIALSPDRQFVIEGLSGEQNGLPA